MYTMWALIYPFLSDFSLTVTTSIKTLVCVCVKESGQGSTPFIKKEISPAEKKKPSCLKLVLKKDREEVLKVRMGGGPEESEKMRGAGLGYTNDSGNTFRHKASTIHISDASL